MRKPAFFNNMNARTKILMCVTAAVLAIFLFEKFFFSTLRVKIKNIDKEIKLKEVELKSGVAFRDRKGIIAEDYKVYKGYLSDKGLSEADLVARFLKEVEGIAQRTKVSIVSLTPGNHRKEAGGNKVFYADARIEATVDQFYSFVSEIQNSKLLIKIDKLAVTVKDEKASALRVDATISMTAL